MLTKDLKGSCLCGQISFAISPPIKLFQYCHCQKCQKTSGSAFASNMYAKPDQLQWLSGEQFISRYEDPEAKYFSYNFCSKCGSGLPWLTKLETACIIPAGSLDDEPNILPSQSIYWASRPNWYQDACEHPIHDELPAR